MKHTIYLFVLCATLAMTTGCTGSKDQKLDTAWQQYKEAYRAKDIHRALAIIDSMEQAKAITTAKGDYMRAIAYDQGWQTQIAEHYYRKAYEAFGEYPSQDWYQYGDAGFRLAYLRMNRGDTDEALSIVSGLLDQAKENEAFPKEVETSLLMLMADLQMELHQDDEARHNWQKAYDLQLQARHDNPGQEADLPWLTMSISCSLFDLGDIEGAQEWLDRCAQEFAEFEQVCNDSLLLEEWRGHLALKRARYLQATGRSAEAKSAYAAVPRSRIFEPHGYMEAAEYAMAAGRYDEAAYWYEQLDSTYLATDGAQMTFDNISSRLSPRYLAYRKAGRDADALVIADSISAAIDSALVWQKKNAAAELAVIYQTHEKDLQLTKLRFMITLHRFLVATLIVILLLIAYFLWRAHQYNKVLDKKNRHLYGQIQQQEQAETEEREKLQAQPIESLTTEQQLFRRLCTLMADQQPFTDGSLNRDKLAQLLGTNPKYIDQTIHDYSHGETTSIFINRYRVEHVARLLKTTDEPISVIGEMAGIPSRSTLARLFRNTYGMTCSEFRQVAKEKD